ncbi:O-antigen ABC transporter ATP-binding protein (plasmid) [Acidiphilium multivorum AIU301]|uniref:O-antigen ABC transporter ATP-binding protein n=1 Tax=Acidiphilium multivorum (strain DSM 11245 / JCM 8867 / NBRC 100883 / AIU 301) TaxID=926570 RepID=F0J814_ACIMA|nr:ABC transporter ATP-binding protein [Acidiphilium multivorum]BAJ83231.1 O-antigen ABC transporter ATP-binding protein [Acidiphilium multivorum AIU301]
MAHLTAFNISVDFPLYHSDSRSLKKTIMGRAASRFGQDQKHRPVVQALRNISFSLRSGDRLGLIGSNGSGKTTLLRALSGIYQPTVGSLSMEGRLTSLLDPGQGMNTDLTGRENIQLRGQFLGLPRAEIDRLEADVEDFSELAQFLDLPVRSYSSGMVVRLAFAMATAFPPELLLMDEWILAGDAAFMEKAKNRIEGMVRHADILILASHSPVILAEWCNRLVLLDNGQIKADGEPMDILEEYLPSTAIEEVRLTVSQKRMRKQRVVEEESKDLP